MDKIIIQTVYLTCTVERAFELFTVNRHLESWLCIKADVGKSAGDKYELFWEPGNPENNSTIGCKILAVDETAFINFEWKGPVEFKHFMNNSRPLTNVTILFTQAGKDTKVTLVHTGWGDSSEWEEARQYFIRAWKGAFSQLEDYERSL